MTQAQVAEGVHRVTSGVANWYAVLDGGRLTIVDAGPAGDWTLLQSLLATLGRTLADVETVLLTHAHSDHTGFAERARSEGSAIVRVHSADEAVAKGGKAGRNEAGALRFAGLLIRAEAYRTLFGLMRHGGMRIVPVVEVTAFADGEVLDVPGRPRVLHMPGHTPGSCALLFDQHSVLCSGDCVVTRDPFSGRVGPRVMPAVANVSTAVAVESLGRLEGAHAALLLPGHGEPWRDGVDAAVAAARRAAGA